VTAFEVNPTGGRSRRPSARSTLLAALLALVVLAFAPTASAQDPFSPPGFFGVSESVMGEQDFALLHEADAGTFRTVFPFAAVRTEPGVPYDWEGFDNVVRETAERGLELVPNPYGVPNWVSEERWTTPIGKRVLVREWREFLTALVRRYGPEGEFWSLPENEYLPYQPIRTWQIWNEPNSITWWFPRPRPSEYALLLERSARAIHAVDPEAQIMTAGIVARPTNRHAIRGSRYLTRLFNNRNARAATDLLGFHPFAPAVRGVQNQIESARKILNRAGIGEVPIWVTEVGWGSRGPEGHALIKSEKGQVRALEGTFEMALRERERLGIARVLWYHWRDYRDDLCRWCESSGLVNRKLGKKPLYQAFQRIANP
jgi:hypothetical protein